MSLNERNTENLVREALRTLGYYSNPEILVEEQKSTIAIVDTLLQKASKKGNAQGYPEFIITSKNQSNFVIIIECKADPKKHESANRDKIADYAVDGALWYGANLSTRFDVLTIGVSGEDWDSILISCNLLVDGIIVNNSTIPDGEFLRFEDYVDHYIKSPQKFNQEYQKLLEYSKELNDFLHLNKVKEAQRSLLISSILIALKNRAFVNSYQELRTAKRITQSIVDTIVHELADGNLDDDKIKNLRQAYSFIITHTTLSNDKGLIIGLINEIDERINQFIKTYEYFDALGQFYIEFLRYANNDKGLGIVLTPPHITELFSDLAYVNKDSIVVDNCCGTAGFMISAMQRMVRDAKGNSAKIESIKQDQLIGIEFQDDIYALAVSNMIIHEDGKTNIFHGSCFDAVDKIPKKGTVGFLNPPYKSNKHDVEELDFILNNLEMLERNGTCIAIVPQGCLTTPKGRGKLLKKKLLQSHTLEAVMSMPNELFYNSNVGVVTSIIVIKAHIPHPDYKKTWFGFWKDDLFVKVKNKGRVDIYHKWEDKKQEWVYSYYNRETHRNDAVASVVTGDDEWCAEAYLQTDYSTFDLGNVRNTILNYLSFLVQRQQFSELSEFLDQLDGSGSPLIDLSKWEDFKIGDIFDVQKGKRLTKANMQEGEHPFVGAIDKNNGHRQYIAREPIHTSGTITVNYNGSVGEAFYQPEDFWASDDVNVLYPKFNMDKYSALFICTVLKMEKFKYSFGRKWYAERMKDSVIKLPAENTKIDSDQIREIMKSIKLK